LGPQAGTARALGWNRTLTLLQEIRGVKGQRPFSAAELDPLRRDERAIRAAAQAQGIYLRRLGELPASGPVVVPHTCRTQLTSFDGDGASSQT